jgi:hypothetical protein
MVNECLRELEKMANDAGCINLDNGGDSAKL